MRSNKVEYSTSAGVYCTTHDVKVPFCVPELSISNIINHRFRVDNDKGESGIGYDMIIGRDLMVQLGLTAHFTRQELQWGGDTVYMKEPRSLLGQYDLTKCEMFEMVMQTAEPAYNLEATDRMVKILDSTYVKAYFKQVTDNASQLNYEEINLLLILIKDFGGLFDGTLVYWATEPVDFYLNAYSKPFNSIYYPFHIINKETFRMELKRLLEIGVLTPVHQSQYNMPVFIVPNK